MKAAVLRELTELSKDSDPLSIEEVADPEPSQDELLVRVSACGVCHTELDEIEGRTPPPELPVILGHQVVGSVQEIGDRVPDWSIGDRVGVAWIYRSCGQCRICRAGLENLCPALEATGRDADGGYAEHMTVSAAFAHSIPDGLDDTQAAPLLCAGALAPGGRLVINAIRKEAADQAYLQKLDYPEHLWMEKEIKSVANVARRDVREFLELAVEMQIAPEVEEYELDHANEAIRALKSGGGKGAKVISV